VEWIADVVGEVLVAAGELAVPEPGSDELHPASTPRASAAPATASRCIYDAQSKVRVTAFFQSA
jgi:hypothetical protein